MVVCFSDRSPIHKIACLEKWQSKMIITILLMPEGPWQNFKWFDIRYHLWSKNGTVRLPTYLNVAFLVIFGQPFIWPGCQGMEMLKNYTIEEVVKSDYARHPTLYYKCKEQTGDLPKWGIFLFNNSSGWNPSCFLCGYTSNAARGKRLQGRSLFLN